MLTDVAGGRSGDVRLRTAGPNGAVTFERGGLMFEAPGEASDPMRVRVDFPASSGSVSLDAQRERAAGGDEGRNWDARDGAYRELRYRGVASGIDLTYRSRAGQPVGELMVGPGGSLGTMRLRMRGVLSLEVDNIGRLVLRSQNQAMRWAAPVVFQSLGGQRIRVKGGYRVIGINEVQFWAGVYDTSLPLYVEIGRPEPFSE